MSISEGEMRGREGLGVGNRLRDATETQRRSPGSGRKTSTGRDEKKT